MNAAKMVQIMLVALVVVYAVSVGVGFRSERGTDNPDEFEPPNWMLRMDQWTGPLSPQLTLEDLRLADREPMGDAPVTVTETTTLLVEPAAASARRARFEVSGGPARLTYEPAEAEDDADDVERDPQVWPSERNRHSPASFSIFREGGVIRIEPTGDRPVTVTLEQ